MRPIPADSFEASEPLPVMSAREIGSRAHVINFRHSRGWSQREAGSWWGVSERQWRRYESGESRVPAPLLKRLARYRPPGVHVG